MGWALSADGASGWPSVPYSREDPMRSLRIDVNTIDEKDGGEERVLASKIARRGWQSSLHSRQARCGHPIVRSVILSFTGMGGSGRATAQVSGRDSMHQRRPQLVSADLSTPQDRPEATVGRPEPSPSLVSTTRARGREPPPLEEEHDQGSTETIWGRLWRVDGAVGLVDANWTIYDREHEETPRERLKTSETRRARRHLSSAFRAGARRGEHRDDLRLLVAAILAPENASGRQSEDVRATPARRELAGSREEEEATGVWGRAAAARGCRRRLGWLGTSWLLWGLLDEEKGGCGNVHDRLGSRAKEAGSWRVYKHTYRMLISAGGRWLRAGCDGFRKQDEEQRLRGVQDRCMACPVQWVLRQWRPVAGVGAAKGIVKGDMGRASPPPWNIQSVMIDKDERSPYHRQRPEERGPDAVVVELVVGLCIAVGDDRVRGAKKKRRRRG
ncbi:hypothetical protein CVT26_011322 [Gymnopilus dilepis]|uniref:Uncharacterized protein n=1 Tax=Gymnopilus dilepis TaxID=231916 RepID=A0A409X4G5_9AGAR|nr:hypothetical protein CVT26_011322 [Gymnopilus dilepis]